jgi:hypothetical protein
MIATDTSTSALTKTCKCPTALAINALVDETELSD